MWQRREVHLKRQARDSAEYVVVVSNLVDDLVRSADNQRTMRACLRVEVSARDGPPATLATCFGEALNVAGNKFVDSLFHTRCHVPERVHAYAQSLGRMPGTSSRLAIKIHQRPKPPRVTADDRDHQRQPEHTRTRERVWGASDPQPDWQWILHRSRIHTLPAQGRPELTRPRDVLVGTHVQQEVQLLGKQRVVVVQVVAEEWEGFDRRASADNHLGPSLRNQVERRELLEQAHRVRRAQNGHRAGQTNASCASRRCSQDHRRRRVEELALVVFADSENTQPDLVRLLDALEQLAHAVDGVCCQAGVVEPGGEAINSYFHLCLTLHPRQARDPPLRPRARFRSWPLRPRGSRPPPAPYFR